MKLSNTDNLMDVTAELINTPALERARSNRMKKAHVAGSKACEICGRAIGAKSTEIAGSQVGPECTKKLSALGYTW